MVTLHGRGILLSHPQFIIIYFLELQEKNNRESYSNLLVNYIEVSKIRSSDHIILLQSPQIKFKDFEGKSISEQNKHRKKQIQKKRMTDK